MRAFTVSVFLLVVLGIVPARADEPAVLESAREAFRDAERAYEQGDRERALTLFQLAFQRAPRDAVRFNIAVCLEELGRFAEAKAEYDAAAASTTLDIGERDRAKARSEVITSKLGTLSVESTTARARIAINGSDRCAPPCRIWLDPGDYTVVLSADGRTSSKRALISANQVTSLSLSLDPLQDPTLRTPQPLEDDGRAGWLTAVGAISAGVGVGGIIGFGVRADDVHDAYLANPTQTGRDEGLVMRGLANASIAVASVGAVLVVGDLLLFRTGRSTAVTSPSRVRLPDAVFGRVMF
jgi:hypothetical protein